MGYGVNLKSLSEQINPLTFTQYLTYSGWKSFPTKREDIKVFQFEGAGGFYQATLPLDKRLSDYKEAMYQAVSELANAEKKTIEQVMLHLLNPNSDIFKIRLERKNIEAGSILFSDAIAIYENARNLLGAAAQDILHPQRYHKGRYDPAVSKFLSECRFGQTEIGSYVISIVCPFAEIDKNDEYKQLSLFSDVEDWNNSLTRRVTNRVMENINDIKRNIDNGDIEGLLHCKDKAKIISANFFDALKNMGINAEGSTVEFIAEQPRTIKCQNRTVSRVTLTHDYCLPIENIASSLKEKTKLSTHKIIGKIKKLESSPDADKRKEGKATVVYINDDSKLRVITVRLDKSDYDRAIYAHEKGSYVEINAVRHEGKGNVVRCESFSVFDD